jgi:ADP-dependent NAD(P)H-hydrate dehydratase / NAD(P)H-hydrate epimerase
MLGFVGTVPDPAYPLTHGRVRMAGDRLMVDGRGVAVRRGTPALLAAAVAAAAATGSGDVYAFLVGDIGRGDGSRRMYRFLAEQLPEFDFQVLTFHYLQPDVDWHNQVLFSIEKMRRRPTLIADAGFMYAAKMSGQAAAYDFFTPDVGELSFLADEQAPHPFYTRGFILHQNEQVPELIQRAYEHKNAAGHLLVKGKSDIIANETEIIETVGQPAFEAMEAIGGTGDTLTGLLTVFCGNGLAPAAAAAMAARANRWTGFFANPTPATQVAELIDRIPEALAKALGDGPELENHGG